MSSESFAKEWGDWQVENAKLRAELARLTAEVERLKALGSPAQHRALELDLHDAKHAIRRLEAEVERLRPLAESFGVVVTHEIQAFRAHGQEWFHLRSLNCSVEERSTAIQRVAKHWRVPESAVAAALAEGKEGGGDG